MPLSPLTSSLCSCQEMEQDDLRHHCGFRIEDDSFLQDCFQTVGGNFGLFYLPLYNNEFAAIFAICTTNGTRVSTEMFVTFWCVCACEHTL